MYEVRCLYCAAFSTQFGVGYLDILEFCLFEYHIVILSFSVLSGGRLLSSSNHNFFLCMKDNHNPNQIEDFSQQASILNRLENHLLQSYYTVELDDMPAFFVQYQS